MAYATVEHVKSEFKELELDDDTSIKNTEVIRFLQETDAFMDAYLGKRYIVPVTGTASVSQVDTVTINTVLNATTYTITVNGVDATYLSDGSATDLEIRDGLVTAINSNNFNEPVTASNGGTDAELVLTSDVPGEPFLLVVDGNQSVVNTTANLLGDSRLDILRKLEIMIVSSRIAKILQLKVNIDDQVKQEMSNRDSMEKAIKFLKELCVGAIDLDGATLISSGAGVKSFVDSNSFAPTFQRGVEQW